MVGTGDEGGRPPTGNKLPIVLIDGKSSPTHQSLGIVALFLPFLVPNPLCPFVSNFSLYNTFTQIQRTNIYQLACTTLNWNVDTTKSVSGQGTLSR